MQQRVAALQQRQLDDAEREASVDTDDEFGSPASPPSKAAAAPPARKPIRAPAVPPPPAPNRPAVPKMQAPMSTSAPKPAPPAPAPVKRAHEDDEPPAAAAAASSSSSGPCSNYSIDLQATEFGMCKCTFFFWGGGVCAYGRRTHAIDKQAATRRARTPGQCSALFRPTPSTWRPRM